MDQQSVPGRPRLGGLEHPGRMAGIAGAGLVSSYAVAAQVPVPEWELDLTQWINDVPDSVATVLYPIMQLGTLGGPIAVAVAVAVFKRDYLLSAVTVLAGFGSWFGAKAVKAVVERGRPLEFDADINVREGDGDGFGYISGHSSVAATAAVMAMAALPRAWRPVAALAAGLVGVARIVHGVHLPADVVGGWSFGTLIALAGLELVDLIDARSTANSAAR